MPQHTRKRPAPWGIGPPPRRAPGPEWTRRIVRGLAVLLFPALLLSCGESPKPAVVAVVNGETITAGELQERLVSESLRWTGSTTVLGNRDAAKEEVLRELLQERLLLQRARSLSLSVTEEELDRESASLGARRPGTTLPPSWRESLRRQLLFRKVIRRDLYETVAVTPGEAAAHFRKNRESYRREERVRALQIVLRDPRRVAAVRNRLKKGEDFAKVAREESVGPEATRGGDLGFFSRGALPDAIDRVAFSMPVGAVSPPVRTPYGHHILKVLEREKGGPPDYAAVRERVMEDIRTARAEAAYGPWMERLQASATIEIRKEALRSVHTPGKGPAAPQPGTKPGENPNPQRRNP